MINGKAGNLGILRLLHGGQIVSYACFSKEIGLLLHQQMMKRELKCSLFLLQKQFGAVRRLVESSLSFFIKFRGLRME